MAQTRNLAEVFDPKHNALNAIRLVLAISVIVWHSFPLTGANIGIAPVRVLVSNIGVDSFFAISGYLIVSSWIRNPRWWSFLRARILRIFPAFWTCLILTVVVFAPVAVMIRGVGFPPNYLHGAIQYLTHNFLLRIFTYDVAGTPIGVPYPHVWNGALWTLFWEFLCYLAVLILGLLRLLRFRVVLPTLFVLALAVLLLTTYGPVHNFYADNGSRFGVMFLAGALVYRFEKSIPVSRVAIAVAAVLVVCSTLLVDYRILAALPLAYLVICLGALGTHPRLNFVNDFSYGTYIYGFPLAQLLATLGAWRLGVLPFTLLSIAATIPVAALSWFLIERQALKLKGPGRTPVTRLPEPEEPQRGELSRERDS